MGADLYIKNLDRESQYLGFEVSDKAVDAGYFRDCYNDSGLFNFLRSNTRLMFSWWQFSDRKSWFTVTKDGDREMNIKGAKEFKKKIDLAKNIILRRKQEGVQLRLQVLNTEYYRDKSKPKYLTKKLSAKEEKEYMDWLNLLLRFLETAIKMRSRIIWSV
jgi:hypothetical protein